MDDDLLNNGGQNLLNEETQVSFDGATSSYSGPPSMGDDHDHEGEEHGEPWLISYADMMTLLFGFFVLMYSFASATDSGKEKIKQSVSEFAGGQYTTEFKEVATDIQKKVKEIQLEGQVDVFDSLDGVKIVSRGTLFFNSASTSLNPQARNLIDEIAKILKKKAQNMLILVEGHTDDIPIQTKAIPSNWELSSLRAGTVVRIFEQAGINRELLRALGLADTNPVLPNRTAQGVSIPENQAENRRIVIHIKKKYQ